jgi:hypothetical protein
VSIDSAYRMLDDVDSKVAGFLLWLHSFFFNRYIPVGPSMNLWLWIVSRGVDSAYKKLEIGKCCGIITSWHCQARKHICPCYYCKLLPLYFYSRILEMMFHVCYSVNIYIFSRTCELFSFLKLVCAASGDSNGSDIIRSSNPDNSIYKYSNMDIFRYE